MLFGSVLHLVLMSKQKSKIIFLILSENTFSDVMNLENCLLVTPLKKLQLHDKHESLYKQTQQKHVMKSSSATFRYPAWELYK